MSGSQEIDLTAHQRAALRSVFAEFEDRIEMVGVYGSRVQGSARPGSDVDLVIYGQLNQQDEARMRAALEESDLSVFADVIAYDAISHPPLKAQIDHWMRPLFLHSELNARRAAPTS